MRLRILALGVSVASILGVSNACKTPPPPVEATESATDGFRLAFAADGALTPSGRAALTQFLSTASQSTDVFILSHGWWNNPGTAECSYKTMIGGLRKAQPAVLRNENLRPVFLGIYWPSAVFPIENASCENTQQRDTTLESTRNDSNVPLNIKAWATVAFPQSPASERAQLEQLLQRNPESHSLTDNDAESLVRLLKAWRDKETPSEGLEDGPGDNPFTGDPKKVVADWKRDVNPQSENEGSRVVNWLGFANAFTFWAMKDRAGVVGSQGVFDVVRALQPLRTHGVKIHLIGHSFGTKVIASAITGHGRRGQPNKVDSAVLLQGAISHFVFSTANEIAAFDVPTSRPGLYVDVVGQQLVEKTLVATFSEHDDKNRFLYPAAVAVNDDFLERDRVSKYGSLGADGIHGPTVVRVQLTGDNRSVLGSDSSLRLFSVNGSAVIKGHSDISNDATYQLIWESVSRSRAQR